LLPPLLEGQEEELIAAQETLRMEQAASKMDKFDDMPWCFVDLTLPISLRKLVHLMLSMEKGWQAADDLNFWDFMHLQLNDKGLDRDSSQFVLPSYFAHLGKPLDAREIESWPLEQTFETSFVHHVAKPKAMQPKQTNQLEKVRVFLVSPRKVVISILTQGSGFTYADCFNIETRFTLSASKPGGKAEAKTRLKVEHRMNLLKSVKFFASLITNESERQLKEAFGEGGYITYLERLLPQVKTEIGEETNRVEAAREPE